MKAIEIFKYYSFGYNYFIIRNSWAGKSNLEFYTDLKRYLDFITELDLRITSSSIKRVQLMRVVEKLEKLAKNKKTRDLVIDEALRKEISWKIKETDLTLDAELDTKIAYLLEEKRFTNEILLENIHQLFSSQTFNLLPKVAKFDFEESGRCLAFDRYTACSFHALRWTEDVLKMYYEKLLSCTAQNEDTWGTFEKAITTEINNGKLIPAPEEQLVINIWSLRKYYRNKTQHPQNIYSSDEAQDLLSLCIKTVNEIISDLKERKLI